MGLPPRRAPLVLRYKLRSQNFPAIVVSLNLSVHMKNMGNPHVIALVENDLPLSRALERLLRAHGYVVRSYPSAELFAAREPGTAIDCLLLDIDLDGMSGLDLQQQLRKERANVPIIFITGRDDPQAKARAFEAGCDGYLCKPFESGELTGALGAALGKAPVAPD